MLESVNYTYIGWTSRGHEQRIVRMKSAEWAMRPDFLLLERRACFLQTSKRGWRREWKQAKYNILCVLLYPHDDNIHSSPQPRPLSQAVPRATMARYPISLRQLKSPVLYWDSRPLIHTRARLPSNLTHPASTNRTMKPDTSGIMLSGCVAIASKTGYVWIRLVSRRGFSFGR